MKLSKLLKSGGFILLTLVLLIAADVMIERSGWVQKSGYFWLDDFEVTRRDHPEEKWDGVIFGSSELISGYREDLTTADYVNLGMDYGVITDLVTLLEAGYINVEHDLVLALNWCALCDTLDTNPTYIWHRAWYEPYVYFQRDRLGPYITAQWNALIGGGEPPQSVYSEQTKIFYYGMMTPEELQERMEKLSGLYWDQGISGYEKNLAALGDVFTWCAENGVRVRSLWLPENQTVTAHPVNLEIRERAREICGGAGVEFYDMTQALPADCFYDTGHMNYEHGAVVFTEVLDKWLLS